jgi:hypothetical protein
VSFLPHEYPICEDTEEAPLGVYADKFLDSDEGWNAWRAMFSGEGDVSKDDDDADDEEGGDDDADDDDIDGDADSADADHVHDDADETDGSSPSRAQSDAHTPKTNGIGASHAGTRNTRVPETPEKSAASDSTGAGGGEPPQDPDRLLHEAITSLVTQRLGRALPEAACRVVDALAQVIGCCVIVMALKLEVV